MTATIIVSIVASASISLNILAVHAVKKTRIYAKWKAISFTEWLHEKHARFQSDSGMWVTRNETPKSKISSTEFLYDTFDKEYESR